MQALMPQSYQTRDPYHTPQITQSMLPNIPWNLETLGRGGVDIFRQRANAPVTPEAKLQAVQTVEFLMKNKKRILKLGQAINLRLQRQRRQFEIVRRSANFTFMDELQDGVEFAEQDFADWLKLKSMVLDLSKKIEKGKKTSTAVSLQGLSRQSGWSASQVDGLSGLGFLPLLILGASAISGASWMGGKAIDQFSEYKKEENVISKLERGELTSAQAKEVLASIKVPVSEKITIQSEIAKGVGSGVKMAAVGIGLLGVAWVGFKVWKKRK